ncbi:CLUMA_CG001326, isoform A [Clunio marinus]|uniref:CLUMA_CG001326, isoform A n=1 Tax=Clunio marinus TaxID=568069 RepID=A0A1J1HHP5_9DIPT|nr:CLUMA_CG001326, isoform A [Clunio marinus]
MSKKFNSKLKKCQKESSDEATQQEVFLRSMSAMGIVPKKFNEEESSANFPQVYEIIEKILKSREHCDLNIVIGSESFECHMNVLKSYSEYFQKSEKSLKSGTIELPEDKVTPEAFNVIYAWMLADESEIPRLHFARIFKAAKFLEIKELLSQIMCFIDENVIGEREALSIYLEAKEINEKTLQGFMMKKISKIFLTFVASWEYLQLTEEEVTQLLQSNRLGVNSELDILFAVIRWSQHEWPSRKSSLSHLMKCVRFELIQSWQLVELKKYPKEFEHIFKMKEIQAMIDDAISLISLRNAQHDGDGDQDPFPATIHRRIINDPMWNSFEFEKNSNLYHNYRNFCIYLKQFDAVHWRKVKYSNPKHELQTLI